MYLSSLYLYNHNANTLDHAYGKFVLKDDNCSHEVALKKETIEKLVAAISYQLEQEKANYAASLRTASVVPVITQQDKEEAIELDTHSAYPDDEIPY